MNVKMKDIPENERPRERLINVGAENLNDEELLAVILKTGTKNMSVKNLATFILSSLNGIENLKNINYHEVKKIKGIGKAKACTLVALAELSKRINREIASLNGTKLNTPLKVFEFYKDRVNNFQEEFYCIFLDASKKVIEEKLIFIGTVNYSLVHPRDIFKEAYLLNAVSIICVHNHPSGEVKPSLEDVRLTNKLKEIGILTEVKVIDHIIIGNHSYYSFLENGKI